MAVFFLGRLGRLARETMIRSHLSSSAAISRQRDAPDQLFQENLRGHCRGQYADQRSLQDSDPERNIGEANNGIKGQNDELEQPVFGLAGVTLLAIETLEKGRQSCSL